MSGWIIVLGQDGINPASASNPLPMILPGGAGGPGTPITASSGNEANTIAVATLAGAAGKTTYITGFQITALGATAALAVTVVVSGTAGGSMSYSFVFPAGVAVAAQPLSISFGAPVAASAANTAIVVTLPASGAGGTTAAVSAQGFQY